MDQPENIKDPVERAVTSSNAGDEQTVAVPCAECGAAAGERCRVAPTAGPFGRRETPRPGEVHLGRWLDARRRDATPSAQ